jgi:DNA-binding NarL/FixJ family response regulator
VTKAEWLVSHAKRRLAIQPDKFKLKAMNVKKAAARLSVSLLEDDAQVREIFSSWISSEPELRLAGEYGSAEQALAGIPATTPDVVLADINLPRMNGIECVRRLKHLLPQTQFVMITVYEDPDHLFHALAAGASGYLLKQTTRAELLAAIKNVQEGGSPMSNNIARKVIESFHCSRPEIGEDKQLTAREWEVLELLARGDLFKEIADHLGISIPTVNSHVRHIYEKLHVQSRTSAAVKYQRLMTSADKAG